MEYANGGELFDFIVQNSRLKEQLASKFYGQLIAGIEYIHKLGVVHRDLKPENLLLDHDENIKIVDFGLSNTYQPGELLKTACGSPCYAAPEMIAGKRYEGLKADIWSSGVILFAMVCGYLPFEDQDTSKLYKKIMAGDFEIPGFISEGAKDLISRILNTDPEDRFTIDNIRRHPWMKQSAPVVGSGILVGYDDILVEKRILQMLPNYGYDAEYAERCIEANKHSSVTAAYFLLLKKSVRNGEISQKEGVSPSPKKLNVTVSYTPRPPLFKLSYENTNPIQHKARRYVKRSNSRCVSREANATCRNRSNSKKRPNRTTSIPKARPLKPAVRGFKPTTPRPPSSRSKARPPKKAPTDRSQFVDK